MQTEQEPKQEISRQQHWVVVCRERREPYQLY